MTRRTCESLCPSPGRPGAATKSCTTWPTASWHAEAAGVRISRPRRGDWRGPLTPELAPAFPSASQLLLSVYVDGVEKLHLHDDINEMVLYLEDDEAEHVRTRLAEAGFS